MARFETPYNKSLTPPHRGGTAKEASAERATGARKWNSWWSRRSPGIANNDNAPARIGIDAGSKTIKLVALDDQGEIVFATYHRHRSDVLSTLSEILHDTIWRYGDYELPVAITGSAGIGLAQALDIPFVQEVVATTQAVRMRYPNADCIIELGGEDAKITYLTGNVEQRMNATCAGGTGDFIDGIASMLGIRTREMSRLAFGAQRTYPIASRCAVFAQTDVRPLVNAGASKADIAQSALESVVDQTLGGLACGRPIRGTVVFLGGPLEHIPALVLAFRRKLGLDAHTGIKPPDAHLFAAMGAVIAASDAPAVTLGEIEQRARRIGSLGDDAPHLPPLFDDPSEAAAFRARHADERVERADLAQTDGPLYLGFDAGSTSVKYALVDAEGALVASDYVYVEGETFDAARTLLGNVQTLVESRRRHGGSCHIARAVVAGYGEDLLRAGLGFDEGVVETVAHLRGARQVVPDVSFVLDIGGQDMKALWVRDGRIVDAVLNEACSSGCGAFVKSSAKSLGLSHEAFSRKAIDAARPLDLGAKCTVFMTSRVRHAQKTGAAAGDIAAGIAYSVVNNVVTRIIGKNHGLPLGDAVVVQGGTFKSDAVLRAFEKVSGTHAVRPDAAHLMGAYGAALVGLDHHRQLGANCPPSSLAGLDQLKALSFKRTSARCPGCSNACLLSVIDFGNGKSFASGNRCDRAHALVLGKPTAPVSAPPNVAKLEQKLLARFGDLDAPGPRGNVRIGILNALNVYGNMPFWHTLFSTLGFSVVVPNDRQAAHLKNRAAETIPSESVCQPAKIAHLRYQYLVERSADAVFFPTFERGTRCPVACSYPHALADNVKDPILSMPRIKAIRPTSLAHRPDDLAAVREAIDSWAGPTDTIGDDEFERAVHAALEAQQRFEDMLARACDRTFQWLSGDDGRRAAVLAGRPYHTDPALLHSIDEELSRLGFAVLPLKGLSPLLRQTRSKRALWKPAKHLCELVEFAAGNQQIEIVALRSFGCGFDAVSCDEAHDLARTLGRPFTELKIDDIADTAHIRIRLRTLAYASRAEKPRMTQCGTSPTAPSAPSGRPSPTPDLCSTAKALVERAFRDLDANPALENLQVPRSCVECLNDALPFELVHLLSTTPPITETLAPAPPACDDGKPKVGLLGNPLIVFDPTLNDGAATLVRRLGWQPVLPDPALVDTEDVRYLDQLEKFRSLGVARVIYLQSFGCLKGHVQSRGALHELGRRFPDMPITVVDYDPESSALNRENRIRLALSQ